MIELFITAEVDKTLSDNVFVINGQEFDLRDTISKDKIYLTEYDSDVCQICIPFHGRKYKVGDPNAPMVPQHPECKCWYSYDSEELKKSPPVFSKLPVKMGQSIFGIQRWDVIVKYNLAKDDIFHNGKMILLKTLLEKYTL